MRHRERQETQGIIPSIKLIYYISSFVISHCKLRRPATQEFGVGAESSSNFGPCHGLLPHREALALFTQRSPNSGKKGLIFLFGHRFPRVALLARQSDLAEGSGRKGGGHSPARPSRASEAGVKGSSRVRSVNIILGVSSVPRRINQAGSLDPAPGSPSEQN